MNILNEFDSEKLEELITLLNKKYKEFNEINLRTDGRKGVIEMETINRALMSLHVLRSFKDN